MARIPAPSSRGTGAPVVAVLVPDPGDLPAGERAGAAGTALAAALFPPRDPPVLVVEHAGEPHRVRRAVTASDLLVIEVPAGFPAWRRAVTRLLDVAAPLAGRAVFGLVTGGWPEAAGRAPAWLEGELRRRGASCLAPALHLPSGEPGRAGITTYCAYWRPVVPTLIGFADRGTVSAAG